jgi:hypothetical protein
MMLERVVVYLPTADKYRRLTRLPLTGAKRSRRGGSHGLPAALPPLVTPSTPAVWTHVTGSGHLPVPFPRMVKKLMRLRAHSTSAAPQAVRDTALDLLGLDLG